MFYPGKYLVASNASSINFVNIIGASLSNTHIVSSTDFVCVCVYGCLF